MKGIILGMIFVFGMSFTADANAMIINDGCFDEAISQSEIYEATFGYRYAGQETYMLNMFYAICTGELGYE